PGAGGRAASAAAGPAGPGRPRAGPAAGCGAAGRPRPATMRRSSWPTSSMASIFKPAMVSRSASAAAGPLQVTNSASQESGMRMAGCSERELPEEAEIVVVEEPEVGEAVAQERQPIGAHAEGEAAHHLGIVAAGAQHVRMDHAGAQDLEPAAAAADAAARVGRAAGGGARRAGDVDLGARLGE